MKRLEREHGRILSVETKYRGDALAEDALAGATTLVVADAGDFDEGGGWLTINGQVVEYTECDDDEGVITLATGLTAAAEQGDAVHLWSEFYQEAVDYQEILVELDGEYDNPETVVAELADGLPELPEGDRGRAAESCVLLRVSDDEWEVVNVGGRPKKSAGMQAEADDAYTITAADVAAGTATMPLTHRPIDESVKGFWGVLPQEPTEYTVNYDGKSITWPLDGVAGEGDRLWVHYWYLVAGVAPSIAYPTPVMGEPYPATECGVQTLTVTESEPYAGALSETRYVDLSWTIGGADVGSTGWTAYFVYYDADAAGSHVVLQGIDASAGGDVTAVASHRIDRAIGVPDDDVYLVSGMGFTKDKTEWQTGHLPGDISATGEDGLATVHDPSRCLFYWEIR